MKTAQLSALFIFFFLLSFHSNSQDLDWLFSSVNGESKFLDTKVDNEQQRVYAVGMFDSGSLGDYQFVSDIAPNLFSTPVNLSGSHAAVLFAFDFDGNLIWEANSLDINECAFTSIDLLPNGAIVVGGFHKTAITLRGTSGFINLPNLDGNGKLDAMYAVFDPDGALIHADNFGGDGDDAISSIASCSDGFVLLTMSDGDADDYLGSQIDDDHLYRLQKIDFDFNPVWDFSLADQDGLNFNDLDDKAAQITCSNDTFFMVAMNPDGALEFEDAAGDSFTINDIPGFGSQDVFVCSFNLAGELNWGQLIDQTTGSLSHGYGIAADCGQVYLTGALHYNSIAPVVFPGGLTLNSSGHDNIFLAALDRETGTASWVKEFLTTGGNHQDYGLGVCADNKGSVYFVGTFSEDLFFDGYFLEQDFDQELFVLVYSEDGDIRWGGSINAQGDDIAHDVDISSDNELFVVGMGGQGGNIFESLLSTASENALLLNYDIPEYAGSSCCIAPSASNLPTDQFLELDANCQAIVPNYLSEVVVNSSCAATTLNQSPVAGTVIDEDIEITITLEDDLGGIQSWNFQVALLDNTPPSASLSLPSTFNIGPADCNFSVPDFSPYIEFASDCSSLSSVQSPAVGTMLDIGTHTFELIIHDDVGNETTITQDFEVIDNAAPIIQSCPGDQTLSVSGSTGILPDFTSSADLLILESCTYNVGQWPGAGAEITSDEVITLTVADASGNSSTCSFNLVFECVPELTVNCTDFGASINLAADCSFTFPGFTSLVNVETTCGQDYTITQNPAPGETIFGSEDYMLEFIVEDEFGTVETCSSLIQFNDITPPTYSCPSNLSVYSHDDCSFDYPDWTTALNASDACGVNISLLQDTPVSSTQREIELLISDGTNESTCTFNLHLIDTIAPHINPIDPQVLARGVNCAAEVPDLSDLVVASDNCTAATELIITQTPVIGTAINVSQTAILNVTDAGGNTSFLEVELQLAANAAPLVICGEDKLEALSYPECTFVLPDYRDELMITDECDFVVFQSPSPGSILSVGVHTINFTVTDFAGATSQCSMILTLEDNEAPIVTVLPEAHVSIDENCNYVFDDSSILFEWQDCDMTQIIRDFSIPLGTELDLGVYEIVLQIQDGNGNETVVSNILHVEDHEAPSVECPTGTPVFILDDNCQILLPDWMSFLNVQDNCTVSMLSENTTQNDDGTLSVALVFTDGSNEVSCNFEANLLDETIPEITNCIANQTLSLSDDCSAIVPDYTAIVNVSDACTAMEDMLIVQDPPAGDLISENQTLTLTVSDTAGNEAFCSFELLIDDSTAPLIDCSNLPISVNLDENCEYIVGDFTPYLDLEDNCEIQSITQSPHAGSAVNAENITIQFTVVDASGNTSTCDHFLEVEDETAPTISWIADQTFTAGDDCSYTVLEASDYATWTDCSPSTLSIEPEAGTILDIGEHEISITAMDDFGNTSEIHYTIEVEALYTPIIISCGEVEDQYLDASCMFELPDFTGDVVWNTACSSDLSLEQNPSPGTLYDSAQEIQLTFTLVGGNEDAAPCFTSFELLNTNPVSLSCEDVTIPAVDCGVLMPELDFFSFEVFSCDAYDMSILPIPGTYLELGDHTVNIELMTEDGAISNCSFILTVEDQNAPTIDCNAIDLPVIQGDCSYVVEDFTSLFEVSDNCPDNITITQNPIGTNLGPGEHLLEFIISDGIHEVTCSKTLSIVDNEAPVFEVYEDIILVQNEFGICGAEVNYDEPSILPNCSEETINLVQGLPSGSLFPFGESLLVFEASDEFGNTSTLEFSIIVEDQAAPEFLSSMDPVSMCQGPIDYIMPQATDCGEVNVVQVSYPEFEPGAILPIGEYTVEFQAIDEAGNVSSMFWDVSILEQADASWASLPSTICSSEGILNFNDYYTGDENPSWNWGDDGVLNLANHVGQILDVTLSLDEGNCSADSTQSIHIIGPPTVDAGENMDVCGLEITLNGETNANNFWWEGPIELTIVEEGLACDITSATLGVFEVSFYASNGTCTSRDDVELNFVESLGELSIPESFSTSELSVPVQAGYEGPGTITWSTNSNSSISNPNSLEMVVSNMDEGLNSFFIEIDNGVCDPLQDTLWIDNMLFSIPSGFSPNGDLVNDTFEIIALEKHQTKDLQVFNRWGQLVYQNTDYDNSWNGEKEGIPLPDDTYYYVLLLDENEFTGYVVIRR
jgi:gliding motility-associated-like protein